jgi:hypothetical protein
MILKLVQINYILSVNVRILYYYVYVYIYIYQFFFQNMQLRLILTREIDIYIYKHIHNNTIYVHWRKVYNLFARALESFRKNNYNSSCTGSIWAGKWYSLDRIHFCYNYTITEQNVAFLVPDSCRVTQGNDMSIRADVTDAAFQNVQNDASFSYFQIIWNELCMQGWRENIPIYTAINLIMIDFEVNLKL